MPPSRSHPGGYAVTKCQVPVQDVLEDFQDLQPEESVYLRRWNDAEVAHFQQNGFWSARNLPEVRAHLRTPLSMGTN